ncbi:MAG: hypothetical protein MUD05_07750 [Candidatus Nanopelagicales bacterium]|jgi:hypothetical protein|nr:hypothetical protein [Candidatus Nanopelagicales bacterium]
MSTDAVSKRRQYGVDVLHRALDQIRAASGDLHVATQHLPMNLSIVAADANTHLARVEMLLEDLEKACRVQLEPPT